MRVHPSSRTDIRLDQLACATSQGTRRTLAAVLCTLVLGWSGASWAANEKAGLAGNAGAEGFASTAVAFVTYGHRHDRYQRHDRRAKRYRHHRQGYRSRNHRYRGNGYRYRGNGYRYSPRARTDFHRYYRSNRGSNLGCRRVSTRGYWRGYPALVGGRQCFDRYGRAYIAPGSRFLIRYH